MSAWARVGSDRNAHCNGIAYSFGGGKAYQLQLSDFDAGTQQAATTAVDALSQSDTVEHLVPRPFAVNDDKDAKAHLMASSIVHEAAKLTSQLLQKKHPVMYDHMSRHAPNYRLFGDVLWTTARVAFMREGSQARALRISILASARHRASLTPAPRVRPQVKKHSDKENMPGTLGADMILSFGDVRGATLTLHGKDGEKVEIKGAKTVLADFMHQHEVSELEGSGLRVALVFWQQRTVVLSDHVINTLDAHVFPPGWKTLVPHPQPLSHERSANGDLVFVLGPFGAGKTTVVRALVDKLQTPEAKASDDRSKGAWLIGNDGAVAIFGRWSGHHADGSSAMAGRLDGCDRLGGPGGEPNGCKVALPALHESGVRLLVADGLALLNEPFLQLARHVGYEIRLLELNTSAEEAKKRAQERDKDTDSAGKEDPWSKKREKWCEELTTVSPEEATSLLLALADADPNDPPVDDEQAKAERAIELHRRAREGQLQAVRVLLGVDPTLASQPDPDGATALWHAVAAGQQAVVRALLAAGATAEQLFNTAGVDALAQQGAGQLDGATREALVGRLRDNPRVEGQAVMAASKAAQDVAEQALPNPNFRNKRDARQKARVDTVHERMLVGLARGSWPLQPLAGSECERKAKTEYAESARVSGLQSSVLPPDYKLVKAYGLVGQEAKVFWNLITPAICALGEQGDCASIIAFKDNNDTSAAITYAHSASPPHTHTPCDAQPFAQACVRE